MVTPDTRYGVYPRVYGGTANATRHGWPIRGLSPRVRGNRVVRVEAKEVDGSIPACAGEPSAATWTAGMRTVYPRVCGGTISSSMMVGTILGLSPRMRGNPLGHIVWGTLSGVYPRVNGGVKVGRVGGRLLSIGD